VSCRLTFDSTDSLTELSCDVDGLTWRCDRPGDLYVCRWSDDPECGGVYGLDGVFEARLCGSALDERINRGRTDGGVVADAGVAPDASTVADSGAASRCYGLDEAGCNASPNCRGHYCPQCGGQRNFITCTEPNDPVPPCAPPRCPCEGLDLMACEQNADCHAVFVDNQNCGCGALGCCAQFARCAEGATADCRGGNVICDAVPPYCEGEYVVAFTGGCYEGCVRAAVCEETPVACYPQNPPLFPSFDKTCQARSDCEIAMHRIDCCGSEAAIGISNSVRMSFDTAEATCRGQYPPCRCAARPPVAEDGNSATDPTRIDIACTRNQCTTFVR
jgi:hypothetical protein